MKKIKKDYEKANFEEGLNILKSKVMARGNLSYVTVLTQLKYIELLSEFPLGRYLIEHENFNSYWTDYLMPSPSSAAKYRLTCKKKSSNLIHDFILNHSLLINGWRQTFLFFQKLLQERLKEGITLASIPCGEMRDVLSLDYSNINQFKIFGLDIDPSVISSVKQSILNSDIAQNITLIQGDAWKLPFDEELDVVSSCGLNIYETNRERALDLYREFYRVLKPNGTLIIGFLTYPPWETNKSEWIFDKVPSEYPLLEKILFKDLVELKCRNYRTSNEFKEELTKVGFSSIHFYYDKHRVFPTVTAIKKCSK